MNALKTGIYAKSLVIFGEDPAQFAILTDEYYRHYRPVAPAERDQVDILIRCVWTLRRLGAAEAHVWAYEIETTYKVNENAPLGQAFKHCDRALDRLQRFVNSTQRNYRNALHELERLQSLPLEPGTGSNLDPASPCPPVPNPEPPATDTPGGPSGPAPCAPPTASLGVPQPTQTAALTAVAQFVPSTSVACSSEAPRPFHRAAALLVSRTGVPS